MLAFRVRKILNTICLLAHMSRAYTNFNFKVRISIAQLYNCVTILLERRFPRIKWMSSVYTSKHLNLAKTQLGSTYDPVWIHFCHWIAKKRTQKMHNWKYFCCTARPLEVLKNQIPFSKSCGGLILWNKIWVFGWFGPVGKFRIRECLVNTFRNSFQFALP